MEEKDSQYAIVELMGHKIVAGRIEKSELLGKPMLRVDVPSTSAFPEFTQFYGDAAVYCVTFVSEEVARKSAEQFKVNPVSVYVPDLVTKEKYDELRERAGELQQEIKRLKMLPMDDESDEDEEENS